MTKVNICYKNVEIDQNEWLRSILKVHFDKNNGTPYWLEKEKELGINVIETIDTVDDLHHFGLFNLDDLRNRYIGDFIPKSVKSGTYYVFETGGTTGAPKRAIYTDEYWNDVYEYFQYALKVHKVPLEGQNWLYAGPTGPHTIGSVAMQLVKKTKGTVFTIDLDSRFIKIAIMQKRFDVVEMYLKHIEEQSVYQMQTQRIGIIFTTSKILELLPQKTDTSKMNLKGIVHGGTSTSPDSLKIFHEEFYPNMPIIGFYGNALFGCAAQELINKDTYDLDYYPQYPQLKYSIVKSSDPLKNLPIGQEGRVLCNRMTPGMFLPNILERDKGISIGPSKNFPWSGIRNPVLDTEEISDAIEGVY